MGSLSDHWADTLWTQRLDLGVPMWQKSQVAYVPFPNQLQHLDVWVPAAYTPYPESYLPTSWLPDPDTLWVIYVHGGAWRDPLVTSESFIPTLKELPPAWFESRKAPVAFASISYSLSPYPHHPTHPSDPRDESRNAAHPQHILDVLEAISYLQKRAGFGNNYILVGHSCGATLAFQAAVNPARWGVGMTERDVQAPRMIVGLNGLYDMPELVENPEPPYDVNCEIYSQLTRNAFGDDEDEWKAISPAFVRDWAAEWPDGRRVMLVRSPSDSLVPPSQRDRMEDSLFGSKRSKLAVQLRDGDGDHDDIWKEGSLLAEFVIEAIDMVSNLACEGAKGDKGSAYGRVNGVDSQRGMHPHKW
ncbi:hypothetical protein E4U10_005094 [Claviceps purpurea]|nr:hypothetical protein E4U10_005094 [Claviceps purpurea]